MEKIKEYKGIIILTLVVFGGAFYWYEWRPTQIRKECSAVRNMMDPSVIIEGEVHGLQHYTDCLRLNGLEK